ncbi:MAG: alkaline phosphatase family protein [Actinomycetes bacterium]
MASSRRIRMSATVLAIAAAGLCGVPVGSASAASSATTPAARTPIRHFVVMMQDHHSFDNYFGSRQGVDGLPSTACQPLRTTSDQPCVKPFPIAGSDVVPALDPTSKVQAEQVAGGRMNGFVTAQQRSGRDGRAAMGYYQAGDIKVLNELADRYVLFDRWFSSVPGSGVQNRLFAMAGRSAGDTGVVPKAGWGDFPLIFDRLEQAGVPWRVYVENYAFASNLATAGARERAGGQIARVPLLAMAKYVRDPKMLAHVSDFSRYYRDLAAGTLPAVSFVVTTSATEHPPENPGRGQLAVRKVVNALQSSTAWPSSALLLTYDTSGGWYDHVPPVKLDGQISGLRVPAVLVSPYARAGAVNSSLMDHASILRFIEDNWSLPPLTRRDKIAGDLSTALSFTQQPRPAQLVSITGTRRVVAQPNSTVLYAVYGLVLLMGLSVAVAVTAMGRRTTRPRTEGAT